MFGWSLQDLIETCICSVMFWENDKKRIGNILRVCHHAFMYLLLAAIIISHTLLPSSFLLLVVVYIICVTIWLQHIITGGCIISKIEQKLLEDDHSFVDPFLKIFNIPITRETTIGITVMGSTTVVALLGLEVFSRLTILIWQALNII